MYTAHLTLTTVSECVSPSVFQVFQLQSKNGMSQIYLTFVRYLSTIHTSTLPFVSLCRTLCCKEKLLRNYIFERLFFHAAHVSAAPDLHRYVKWQNGIVTQMYQGLFL